METDVCKSFECQKKIFQIIQNAGLILTLQELQNIEIVTFGLTDYPTTGLQVLTYISNTRYCAKELVLLPYQTCPEHRHPLINGHPGMQETFRYRWGTVYLFVDDDELPCESDQIVPGCNAPENSKDWYTCTRYILLRQSEQYTIKPDTLHWFQAGKDGAVISVFSSESREELDIFTDPLVSRFAEK
ncbi:D-lyxose/D-mannose family sugar isomerase [Salmonella enterica subsp. enterica]|nr:D-lyxose/D-mannose family sugar isomerase [Salmonella enterica subsp. enterica serovar Reading]MLO26079.1 D-lyxose/D-mannose family sugar isomerase [Salmonella enterica subsp. enterica serovar Reading]